MSKPVRLVLKDSLAYIGILLADIFKIIKFMSETWLQFFEGKIDANAVLEKYKEQGFTNGLSTKI